MGRPLKFKTVEELEAKIRAYFDSCWETTEIEKDDGSVIKTTKQIRPYTISGLAVALDTSRETLINYEKREEFFDTIKGAKDKCEAFVEEQLFTGKNAAGPIFNLKNNYAGWKDKTEVENSGHMNLTFDKTFDATNPLPKATGDSQESSKV